MTVALFLVVISSRMSSLAMVNPSTLSCSTVRLLVVSSHPEKDVNSLGL